METEMFLGLSIVICRHKQDDGTTLDKTQALENRTFVSSWSREHIHPCFLFFIPGSSTDWMMPTWIMNLSLLIKMLSDLETTLNDNLSLSKHPTSQLNKHRASCMTESISQTLSHLFILELQSSLDVLDLYSGYNYINSYQIYACQYSPPLCSLCFPSLIDVCIDQ